MTKRQKRILLPLLLILAALTLTACRPSTALTRMMNVANALNPSTEYLGADDEDSEEELPDDEDPVEEQSDDADIELENTIGQFMEDLLADETTADQALQAVYSALAEDDEWGEQEVNTEDVEITSDETKITVTLPGGSESDEGQGTASGVTTSNGQESESAVIQPEEEEEEEEEKEQENEEQEDEPETSENTSGGENGDTEDPDLVNDDDPESDYEELETAEGQVAATGQLAILVSMLGGGDRLCATSADYDENELAQKAFSDGDYEVLWDGDGSSPMSDEDFETLLAMKPGLCVYISGYQTFSSTQITQLEAAGITCKPVDGFTSADDIKDTVNELATLLGDTSADGGTNAPEIAASYLDWCAVIEDDLSNISTSSEVVFVEDWDEGVEVMYQDLLADTGCAVIRAGTGFRPLNDYLGCANVTDYSSAPTTGLTYLNGLGEYSISSTWHKSAANGDLVYITPLNSAMPYGSAPSGSLSNMSAGISASIFGAVPAFGDDSSFATVIAKSASVKTALESSISWQTNETTGASALYYPGAGVSVVCRFTTLLVDRAGASVGYSGSAISIFVPAAAPLPETSLEDPVAVRSNIAGDYDVYVNPTGLGDWVDGSAESILESVWVAYQVQGYYTENKMKNIIVDFYSTFYGYDLSATELAEILAGPAS